MSSCTISRRAVQQTVHIHRLQVQLDLAAGDAGEIEKIVDQPRLKLHVPPDGIYFLAKLRRQFFVLGEVTGGGERRRERRAQLMAQHGQEIVFRLVRLFRRDLRRPQCFFRALVFGNVAKSPDPADVSIVDALDFRVTLENPAVGEFQNIETLRQRGSLDLPDPRDETAARRGIAWLPPAANLLRPRASMISRGIRHIAT